MSLSPATWSKSQSPVALLVVRLLLVANALVLIAAGALSFASVARPAGIVGAALL